jgi:hypothetical protein
MFHAPVDAPSADNCGRAIGFHFGTSRGESIVNCRWSRFGDYPATEDTSLRMPPLNLQRHKDPPERTTTRELPQTVSERSSSACGLPVLLMTARMQVCSAAAAVASASPGAEAQPAIDAAQRKARMARDLVMAVSLVCEFEQTPNTKGDRFEVALRQQFRAFFLKWPAKSA